VTVGSLARDVAVVGVGFSPFSRRGLDDPRKLAYLSCTDALADAGLAADDIDGMYHYRFEDDIPTHDVARMLGMNDLAVWGDLSPATGPSGLVSATEAIMAVASGAAETVLALRCMTRATGYAGAVSTDSAPARGVEQYLAPYGWAGVLMGIGMRKRRRLAELGGSEEDYGHVVLNARKWAALNPRAVLRDEITMDDYMGGRMIADPLRVFDCDYPVNGSVAVIVTTAERAKDLQQTPVLVDAIAYSNGVNPDTRWIFGEDFLYGGAKLCADRLWSRSQFSAADVDTAQLYDGFTHLTIAWAEALGLCGDGEFGDWIDGGRTIGPGGKLPMNTSGGHIAEGRVHGLQFLAEAVVQLRGQAGARQVPGAKVAAVTNAGGPQNVAMVVNVA
jgi:acetyl-CoA acetyltransferase